MSVELQYVQAFRDRHGHLRHYFRKAGLPRQGLPGHPGSPEFMAAYSAALAAAPTTPKPREPFGPPGSFHRLIAVYYKSTDFLRTKASSQMVSRGILNRFADNHGHRLVAEMQRQHVMAIIAGMADRPGAANSLLRKLRTLMGFAIAANWIKADPTAKVKFYREGTHHTWDDAELAQFEARWPVGSRQRTGYALALFTGQRRADVAQMVWTAYDERRQTIRVIQEKTGAELYIPAHRNLRETLTAWPRLHLAILANAKGQGTSVHGFGGFMASAIAQAGLPDRCVLHGLRKAAARRLAEAGCTAHQIMAITGHKSLAEVDRYTVAAQQKTMARDAIVLLERNENRPDLSTRSPKKLSTRKKAE